MPLGRLAPHLSELPAWGKALFEGWDFAPPGGEPYRAKIAGSRAEILELFDANVKDARARIGTASDERMGEPWSIQKSLDLRSDG